MSQCCHCAHQATSRCHICVPKSWNYFVKTGNERSTTALKLKTWTILLYSAKDRKRIGSEIRKFRTFRDTDCTFGARVRKKKKKKERKKKSWRHRRCCFPELLALKGLTKGYPFEKEVYGRQICQRIPLQQQYLTKSHPFQKQVNKRLVYETHP